ncbi:MAG TPA: c-type cytochrome [Steroidobacteraceae bacterium]
MRVWLLLAVLLAVAARAAPALDLSAGEAIYLKGLLPSGASLNGQRASGVSLEGRAAACVSCHRRSGLGTTEGSLTIPPISAEYLFHTRSVNNTGHALGYVENAHADRSPYTEETLKRAIRQGLDADGRTMSALMPRFALSDSEYTALLAYLKALDSPRASGVTPTLLHFATIFTPDTDPKKRAAVLAVMQQYFADKNQFPFGPNPQMRTSAKTLYSKSMYVSQRHWQLHLWQLEGPPDSWRAQLERDFAREPVMAVVSGYGRNVWAPVHDFCEQRRVPCLFPNVDVPVVAADDFYSLYFSRGVMLESDLIAHSLTGAEPQIKSVRQIFRSDDSGASAAASLAGSLRSAGVEVQNTAVSHAQGAQALAQALRGAAQAYVLWLRPEDLATLPAAPPEAPVYISGVMADLDDVALPVAWRAHVLMAYPVDLPNRRVVRVDYPLGWFKLRHVELIDAPLQSDTYVACGILAETLSHMADSLVSDYLVERMQEVLDHRILTGYYPRLNLGTGQTVASKGAYLVKFAGGDGTRVEAAGDWIIP